MKRKYPKTKGMAVIFEKKRLQQEINRKVCREISRRVKRREKIIDIIDLLSKPDNLQWFGDMVGKNANSWARTYRRYMAQTRKKRTTVNCSLSPINVGRNAPSKSFIRKHETILPVKRQCVKNRDSRSDLPSQNFDTSPQVHQER